MKVWGVLLGLFVSGAATAGWMMVANAGSTPAAPLPTDRESA